MKPYEEHKIV
jgi:hypothetical protein